jgi:hypothetical protein
LRVHIQPPPEYSHTTATRAPNSGAHPGFASFYAGKASVCGTAEAAMAATAAAEAIAADPELLLIPTQPTPYDSWQRPSGFEMHAEEHDYRVHTSSKSSLSPTHRSSTSRSSGVLPPPPPLFDSEPPVPLLPTVGLPADHPLRWVDDTATWLNEAARSLHRWCATTHATLPHASLHVRSSPLFYICW